METDELTAILQEVRDRVRARHPDASASAAALPLPDLMALVHARDAAEAKVAAIGTVNPRRGGPLNWLVQQSKKMVARALDWHVREQVEFNRNVMACVQAALGITTLVLVVPIPLALAHQSGALALFTLAVCFAHAVRAPKVLPQASLKPAYVSPAE